MNLGAMGVVEGRPAASPPSGDAFDQKTARWRIRQRRHQWRSLCSLITRNALFFVASWDDLVQRGAELIAKDRLDIVSWMSRSEMVRRMFFF